MEYNKVKVNVIILKKKFGSRESGKMEKKKKKKSPDEISKGNQNEYNDLNTNVNNENTSGNVTH